MEDIKSGRKKRGRKKHVLLKLFLALIALILVAAIAGGSYLYRLMGSFNYNEAGHKNNVYVDESNLFSSKDVTNILFLGVDRRNADEKSRSDTMMMLSIDRANKKLKLTSFLRDSWVYIPDHGYAKLNASCSWGGAQLVMDTLEYNFNVKIDHYVLVDFDMFKSIVNKLGGITVEVTEKEAKYLRNDVHLDIQAGEAVKLNGNEALWYCRIRYLDSDFMRTQRQRKVISAIISKAKSTPIPTLVKMVQEILPDVETDMKQSELMRLAGGAAVSYMRYDLEQMRIPSDGTWKNKTIKGQSVLSLDMEKNQQLLYDYPTGTRLCPHSARKRRAFFSPSPSLRLYPLLPTRHKTSSSGCRKRRVQGCRDRSRYPLACHTHQYQEIQKRRSQFSPGSPDAAPALTSAANIQSSRRSHSSQPLPPRPYRPACTPGFER